MNGAYLLLSFLLGAIIGGLYFSGLWFTVRQLPNAGRPALLLIGSFSLRLALFLAAIYLLAASHWSYMVSALAGVLLARTLLIQRWGPQQETVNEKRETANGNQS